MFDVLFVAFDFEWLQVKLKMEAKNATKNNIS